MPALQASGNTFAYILDIALTGGWQHLPFEQPAPAFFFARNYSRLSPVCNTLEHATLSTNCSIHSQFTVRFLFSPVDTCVALMQTV